ncbi:uncharacterized protein [Physcomitrium patens]|uniref:uncharacterized protein isoform X4 n=1 Tax=Physcomitrium patens TaxID=3218 RepID=UPI000D15CB9D|nr:uncharacterized protein LOC112291723 isoform X4 [Physcomitrium patens]|eukprot:XP_024395312.1 uncharacterized protein LOC112291723 isoform X4 [Physcomitrella patens]
MPRAIHASTKLQLKSNPEASYVGRSNQVELVSKSHQPAPRLLLVRWEECVQAALKVKISRKRLSIRQHRSLINRNRGVRMEIVLALMKPELTLLLLLRNERKHLRNQQEDELLDQPLLQRKPHRPAEMNPTSR